MAGGPGRRDDRPLTGRDHDLARVTTALRRSGGVLLVGDAGVGESRLAREVVAALTALELRWVAASASASVREVPLGAFASVLSGDAARTAEQEDGDAGAPALWKDGLLERVEVAPLDERAGAGFGAQPADPVLAGPSRRRAARPRRGRGVLGRADDRRRVA